MKWISLVALAALAASTATVSHAEPKQMRVHVGDLDLTTRAGAQRALYRIRLAAKDFCEIPLELPLTRGSERCRASLIAKAVTQLDAPLVTAMATPSQPIELAQQP